jgi:hypothetical protein
MTDRLRRTILLVTACGAGLAVIALDAPNVAAQLRAPGGLTVYDNVDCAGNGNSPKVTPPFSMLITGLTPNSTTSQLFVTDQDASPPIRYGPFIIPNVDSQGVSCLNVNHAPPGMWKIEVVEEGSGFTDSKVITVEGGQPTTTSTTGSTTSTTGSTTSTTGSTTSTTGSTTSTTAPTTPTTTGPTPFPWDIDPAPVDLATSTSAVAAGELARTGGPSTPVLAATIALGGGILLVIVAARLRRGHSS